MAQLSRARYLVATLAIVARLKRIRRIVFRSIRSRSRAEWRVRAEEKGLYRSFRGIGAFGDEIRSSVHAPVRLLRCKPIMPLPRATLPVVPSPSNPPFD